MYTNSYLRHQSSTRRMYVEDPDVRKSRIARDRVIGRKIETIRNTKEVDFCFVMDCTSSMDPHIQACAKSILGIVDYVSSINRSINVRWGFVGYRDYYDEEPLVCLDFEDDGGRALRTILSRLKTYGGADTPESVLTGLAKASEMSWLGGTRILLHIGDAPPHGRIFSELDDDFPDGDPNNWEPEDVLGIIQDLNILYYFGKINSSTDGMIDVFQEILGNVDVFDFKSTNPKKLVDNFIQASTKVIAQSVTIANADVPLRKKKITINPEKPHNWKTIPTIEAISYGFIQPTSIEQVKSTTYWTMENVYSRKCFVKKAPHPFSEGAERFAYYGRDETRDSSAVVIKEFSDLGQKSHTFERYLMNVETHVIAGFLASEFNKHSNFTKRVHFLEPVVLKAKVYIPSTRDPSQAPLRLTRHYTLETHHIAKFTRFNVNSGIITEFHSTLEAFAHFTYQITGRYLVVTDLQGAEYKDQFLLTDPAIHCIDNMRFGNTNLGKRGINECFCANHVCNEVCSQLGLSRLN